MTVFPAQFGRSLLYAVLCSQATAAGHINNLAGGTSGDVPDLPLVTLFFFFFLTDKMPWKLKAANVFITQSKILRLH